MPRVPYVFPGRGESAIADTIRQRRQDGDLTELDGVLLNAPLIAEGYNAFLRAIRTSNSLPSDLREIMILRVAALNSAAYEWIQHESLARQAGVSDAQLAIIHDVSGVPPCLEGINYKAENTPPPLRASVLLYTDFMTRAVHVPQAVFDALRSKLENDQQMFEATATIAAYNMVSRILVALDVGDKAAIEVPVPGV